MIRQGPDLTILAAWTVRFQITLALKINESHENRLPLQ